ncbi:MAG: DUF1289 domain-containing protein [Thiohalomonadales bacterium]
MNKKIPKNYVLINSPCIRNCCLNEDDHCLGCFRSINEIINWSSSDCSLQKSILENCERRRHAYNKKWHQN